MIKFAKKFVSAVKKRFFPYIDDETKDAIQNLELKEDGVSLSWNILNSVMTQEQKQLLLKDLCARLPYGVKFQGENSNVYILDTANYFALQVEDMIFKPYLRPMSSMTEKEKHKLLKFGAVTHLENGEVVDVSCVGFERHADIQDYLNACHFDYRGLIEMGLALEAPEDMYKN